MHYCRNIELVNFYYYLFFWIYVDTYLKLIEIAVGVFADDVVLIPENEEHSNSNTIYKFETTTKYENI